MVKQKLHIPLRSRLRHATNIHYLFLLAVGIQIIVYDAGKLIPPEVVLRRWAATALLTLVVTAVWFISRNLKGQTSTLHKLLALLIIADICFASYMTYSQRGMASRAVILFLLPILVSGLANRRSAILATAVLTTAAYISTCVAYFVWNFNEGYKLELYGEITFYSAVFIIFGLLLWVIVKPRPTT